MILSKFIDDTKTLTAEGRIWLAHMHKRSSEAGDVAHSTAVVFAPAENDKGDSHPPIDADRRRFARKTAFGSKVASKRASLADVRAGAGRPSWHPHWRPRPGTVLGVAVFDLNLVARALACVPDDAKRVVVEVGNIPGGHVLRIVAPNWRAIVAGRRDEDAPPAKFWSVPTKGHDR